MNPVAYHLEACAARQRAPGNSPITQAGFRMMDTIDPWIAKREAMPFATTARSFAVCPAGDDSLLLPAYRDWTRGKRQPTISTFR